MTFARARTLIRIAGGDRYFVAVNMQPLDRAGQAAQPATDDAGGSREAPRLEIALLDPKEVAAEREAQRRLEARRESEGHARGVERFSKAQHKQAAVDSAIATDKARIEAVQRDREFRRRQLNKLRVRYPATVQAIEERDGSAA